MMFFAVTRPKKKLILCLKLVLLAVLIGLVVPTIYYGLADAGAMESFMQGLKNNEQSQVSQEQPVILTAEAKQLQAAIQQDAVPGEPIRVTKTEAVAPKAEASAQPVEPAEPAKTEKTGIIEKLKELIFGKEPQVEIYSK